MNNPTILIVEAEILVRHPLAEYLRECGFLVIEAVGPDEARQILASGKRQIDVALVDVSASDGSSFGLATLLRTEHPDIDIILAGAADKAVEKAGELCENGPAVTKPYDHQFVLDDIRRLLAARDRQNRP